MSLLDEVKKIETRRYKGIYSNDEVEVAIAWCKEEIATGQVVKMLNKKNGRASLYNFLCGALRQGFRNGVIKETK